VRNVIDCRPQVPKKMAIETIVFAIFLNRGNVNNNNANNDNMGVRPASPYRQQRSLVGASVHTAKECCPFPEIARFERATWDQHTLSACARCQ
jgi:hypothetical protein